VILLDYFLEIVCGSHLLEITSIVAPFPEDTLQESYAIHRSAWKGDSPKFSEMSVVVTPSARETFTPRELTAAYKDFTEHGPQHQDAETGVKAAAYWVDELVLIVYQESETGLVVLIHPTS